MVLIDVNVLVYAFREDAPRHGEIRRWLDWTMRSRSPFGLSEVVLSGFLRVVTHPKVFTPPTPIASAVEFVRTLLVQPNCVVVRPGARQFDLFLDLCVEGRATGNLVPDAYLAALAIENGCQWITTDRDFARFPGLDWKHPD